MKPLICLLITSVISISVSAEEVKTSVQSSPVEIEIAELTPKKGHVKVLSFFYDGKTCSVQTTSKNKRKEDLGRCKKVVESLNKELKQPERPSDYINPKVTYWDVKLKSSGVSWQQTVQKEAMTLCDSSEKCTEAKPVAARTIAKTLMQEFVK
jgi:hypothetical protein